MGMVSEFKEFAMKGNVVDMAVGIIIGGAFGKIISSLVGDVLMPIIGNFMGGVDFTALAYELKAASGDDEAVLIKYGQFIQHIVDFLIIALSIFFVIKALNSAKKKEEAAEEAPAEPPAEEKLLTEIRDLLKKQKK